SRKIWGYAAERAPSTHPVAGAPAPDADTALQNFDGISYAKGAAVLRQLIAHIGDEPFVAGIAAYLSEHAYGNAGLADFLAAMERASGADLGAWAKAWLSTAGLDTVEAAVEADGRTVTGVRISRTPPQDRPADRPHTLDLAGWTDGQQVLRVSATVDAAQVTVPAPGAGLPRVLVPNATDLTWARVRLDEGTLAALPEQLAGIGDAGTRAVVWVALVDALALTEVDPRHFLRIFAAAWPAEDNPSLLGRIGQFMLGRVLGEYLPDDEVAPSRSTVATAAQARLETAGPGSTQALAAARVLVGSTDDGPLLADWSNGRGLPPELAGDADFRWAVLRARAVLGEVTAAEIEGVRAEDPSLQGRLGALTARAALPDAASKAWAWAELTGSSERSDGERSNPEPSNYVMNALATGFWSGRGTDVVRPYVARFHADVPELSSRVGQDALARVATLAYPRTVVEPATDAATTARLARDDLSPAVRRALVDQQSVLREVLASRSTFAGRPVGR
ncbi:MAG: ERAP1-like C-terminal domain-containing protein, partial [Actinomycetota bacterium]|nr:ERAP1-like C-terminal domain-containing protein [Actinomycetota bacterium]